MNKYITIRNLLWVVYVALLAVLWPHTSWLFAQFEPQTGDGKLVSGLAAFAFECAIFGLTHKFVQRLETKTRKKGWNKISYQYLNSYSIGLVVSLLVSGIANLAHAVEFSHPMVIFTWQIGVTYAFQIVFGATLPLVSFLFAWVISNATEEETEVDPALTDAKATIKALNKDLAVIKSELSFANERANNAEQQLIGASELVTRLFADKTETRILTIYEQWPELTYAAIAIMASCSSAYVSQVLGKQKELVCENP